MAAQQAKCGRYEAQKRSFDERSQNVNKFIKTQETALRLVNKVSDFLSIPFPIFCLSSPLHAVLFHFVAISAICQRQKQNLRQTQRMICIAILIPLNDILGHFEGTGWTKIFEKNSGH
jgi:hypothetical protein